MDRRFLLIFFISVVVNASSQTIHLLGKVVDKKTKKSLINVSIQMGKNGVLTDSNGQFSIKAELTVLKKEGFTVSYVGYRKEKITYKPDDFYYIEMQEVSDNLNEVIVNSFGVNSIIEKSIGKISINYPTDPIIIVGILRLFHFRNKTDFYKNDAIIKIYVPPYLNKKSRENVMLVQNKTNIIKDSSLNTIKWIRGGYNIVPASDFVHEMPNFIDLRKMKNYNYSLRGKQTINNNKVFIIDFCSKENIQGESYKKIDGTLYIDTASYAFVAGHFNMYEINEFPFIPIIKSTYHINYKKTGVKWYIQDIHSAIDYKYKNEKTTSHADFICTSLDTIKVERFLYKDIIQSTDVTQQVNKTGNKENNLHYDSIFLKEEKAGNIANLPFQDDGTRQNSPNYNVSLLHKIKSYLSNDNYRLIISLSKLPLSVNKPSGFVTEWGVYSIGLGAQLRLYKNIFFQYEGSFNLGIGGASNTQNTYSIKNNFILNKHYRPLTIAPFIGFNKISFTDANESLKEEFYNWAGGISSSVEMTHKLEIFITGSYNYLFKETNNNAFPISPNKLSISFGSTIKL